MQTDEFNKIMQPLKDTFPNRWPVSRIALVYEKVKDMDGAWLKKIVTEMVIKGDDKVNLIELIAAKRTSDNLVRSTKEQTRDGGEWSSGVEYFKKLGYENFSEFMKAKGLGK